MQAAYLKLAEEGALETVVKTTIAKRCETSLEQHPNRLNMRLVLAAGCFSRACRGGCIGDYCREDNWRQGVESALGRHWRQRIVHKGDRRHADGG